MIFVTVGAQLPFDRLVRAVDQWALEHARDDVFAQTGPGAYVPTHIAYERFMDPASFTHRVQSASLIIAHAGMGSIIGALELGTPIVIMPRRASLGEHRNDHQLATAKRFAGRPGVIVAADEHGLGEAMERVAGMAATPREKLSSFASPSLIAAVRDFIYAGRSAAPVHAPASPRGASA